MFAAIAYSAREGARSASLATTLQATDVDAAIRDHLKAAIPVATYALRNRASSCGVN